MRAGGNAGKRDSKGSPPEHVPPRKRRQMARLSARGELVPCTGLPMEQSPLERLRCGLSSISDLNHAAMTLLG